MCLSDTDAASVAPRAIWSLFYNMELCSVNHELLEGIPTNLYITSDPTGSIVYEEAVAEVWKAVGLLAKHCSSLKIFGCN